MEELLGAWEEPNQELGMEEDASIQCHFTISTILVID